MIQCVRRVSVDHQRDAPESLWHRADEFDIVPRSNLDFDPPLAFAWKFLDAIGEVGDGGHESNRRAAFYRATVAT
jgi:hypothetical protein